MTATKLMVLGFLFILLGFGFLLISLSGIAVSPTTLPANLFVSFPPQGDVSAYVIGLGYAIRAEQGVGLTLIALGFILGVVGCFRRD